MNVWVELLIKMFLVKNVEKLYMQKGTIKSKEERETVRDTEPQRC